jgi:hypothetical protein
MKNFTFVITRVDEAARCMDVVYTADGYEAVPVGVRAPVEGEDLNEVIARAAPFFVWDEIDRARAPLVLPEVGTTGRIEAPPPQEVVRAEPPPEIIMRRVTL